MSPVWLGLLAAGALLAALPPRLRGRPSAPSPGAGPRRRPAGLLARLPAGLAARPAAARRRTEGLALEWLEAVAAELRAGRGAAAALLAAPHATVVVPHAAAAARSGADVVDALRRDGCRDPLLAGVAACWEVAEGSGAGLASSLTTLADAARESRRVRDELAAGLAEPRATAVVLAGLPVLGLALGSMLGADPLRWLLGTPAGRAVLAAGALLQVLGAVWAWRITRALEQAL